MTSILENKDGGVNVPAMREMLEQVEKHFVDGAGRPNEAIEEYYMFIPSSAGHKLGAKVWRHKSTPASERPLILLLHGGGFAAGSKEMCTRPGREFAGKFGAVVVSADYRLCPDHPWPAPVEDGIDIVQWLSDNAADELGANLDKGFVLGGYSAGANIAAVVTHQIKDRNPKHPLTGHFSSIPQLFDADMVPAIYRASWTSREDNESKDPILAHFTKTYHTQLDIDVHSPLFSPFNATEDTWKGLPRTYIQAGDEDLLRDDAVIYASVLEKAGVEVKIDVQADVGHECYSIWYDETKESNRQLKQKTMRGVTWLLRKEWTN